jgi:hypothetical protein
MAEVTYDRFFIANLAGLLRKGEGEGGGWTGTESDKLLRRARLTAQHSYNA